MQLPQQAVRALERAGNADALDDFLFTLLSDHPELSFWDSYFEMAAKSGHTERMLTLVRAAVVNEELEAAKRHAIRVRLYRALLAAGEIEGGIAELRRLIANPPSPQATRSFDPMEGNDPGLWLARLGLLLDRPALVDEGIQHARAALQTATPDESYFGTSKPVQLAELLLDADRGREAEEVLMAALKREVQEGAAPRGYGNPHPTAQTVLTALAEVYHRADRPSDVLALLDKAPYWGAVDLAGVIDWQGASSIAYVMIGNMSGGARTGLGAITAAALSKAGRAEESRRLVNALLEQNAADDDLYELLVQWDRPVALARLDALFAKDRFEERPLIWKAELLRRDNRLAEAETVIRQAIAIDPSDGEQGPGRRMRAYAVLGDIREARGDAQEAALFRGAVRAVRLSERADRFYEAGLLKRAVAMYQESLDHFVDAYCIQSRLAIRLAEMGRHEEAVRHYRKAYELMPDSFGRVESHCFGCEQAFDGQRAQSVAEAVFTGLVVETPNKPQVHYLLGYLREEQERLLEALAHYQKAVELDPDYLNAWAKIGVLSQMVDRPSAERDNAILNIIRLDPLQRHTYANYSEVTHLRALWQALSLANDQRVPQPETVYPLTASTAKLKEEESGARPDPMNRFDFGMPFFDDGTRSDPAHVVAQSAFVSIAIQILNQARQSSMF